MAQAIWRAQRTCGSADGSVRGRERGVIIHLKIIESGKCQRGGGSADQALV